MSDHAEGLALGPEWAALELLARGDAEVQPQELVSHLTCADFHWGELLEQALRHQMLPLVAFHALELAERGQLDLPGRLEQHLSEVLEANRWYLTVFRREAARIAEALRARGVPFCATKGITFESTLYEGKGVRTLKDVDFMIAPGARAIVSDAMKALGFAPGIYDRATGSIVAHPRKENMRYVLNPDHLPRHARLTNEPCVPYLYVDFANSLTWTKSPYDVPVEDALRGCVELSLPGMAATLPTFGPGYQFLFTVLHLFREAWLEQWVELELDVSLMKFGDVMRLVRAHRGEYSDGRLAALLDRHGVAEPVTWVLQHADRTFGTGMTAALGLEGRVNEDWLASAHPAYGRERTWRGTMRERLWAKDRRALFTHLEKKLPAR